ncbi:hypothetical protein GCM10010372_78750 [Streptomyces tauricus]|nr:hypothetical protein GCM10010372_78750 [Streptomyces tauricus]
MGEDSGWVIPRRPGGLREGDGRDDQGRVSDGIRMPAFRSGAVGRSGKPAAIRDGQVRWPIGRGRAPLCGIRRRWHSTARRTADGLLRIVLFAVSDLGAGVQTIERLFVTGIGALSPGRIDDREVQVLAPH